jgi:hypothetical protein
VPLVQESIDGTPRAISKARGDKLYETWPGIIPPEGRPFLASSRSSKIALSEFDRIGYMNVTVAWIKGMIVNLLAPATSVAPVVRALPHKSFFMMKAEGLFDKIVKIIFQPNGSLYTNILIFSGLLIPVWLILSSWGFTTLLRRGRASSINALFLFIWGGYSLGIAGPVVNPKYRLPLEGVWIVFTVIGFLAIRGFILRNKQTQHDRTN